MPPTVVQRALIGVPGPSSMPPGEEALLGGLADLKTRTWGQRFSSEKTPDLVPFFSLNTI